MVASPRDNEPKLPKRRGGYHETTKQPLSIPNPTRDFRLLSTVGQYATCGSSIVPFNLILSVLISKGNSLYLLNKNSRSL